MKKILCVDRTIERANFFGIRMQCLAQKLEREGKPQIESYAVTPAAYKQAFALLENEGYDCLVTDLAFSASWNSDPPYRGGTLGEPPGVVLAEFARNRQPEIITIAITGAVFIQSDYASAFDKVFVKGLGDPDKEAFNYLNERFKE